MFSWQKQTTMMVEIGETYCRENGLRKGLKGDETAKVVSIWDDEVGIPHVRFQRRVGGSLRRAIEKDDRTLALSAFLQLYPERAPA